MARLADVGRQISYVIVFPHPGMTFVKLTGPGDSISGDLRQYWEEFGMSSDIGADAPRIGQAHGWLADGSVSVRIGEQKAVLQEVLRTAHHRARRGLRPASRASRAKVKRSRWSSGVPRPAARAWASTG